MLKKHLPFLILLVFLGLYLRNFHLFELFRSHDLEIHGARLANYYLAYRQGQFPPRWAPNLNYGFGYPVFIVSYALLHLIGLIFYIVSNSIEVSLNLTIMLSIISAGWGMYVLGKQKGLPWLGLVLSSLYLTTPYSMATIFIRGALAEITFLGLLPWIFVGIDRFFRHPLLPLLSIIYELIFAAFLLSHPPSLVVSLPIIGLYVLVKSKIHKVSLLALRPLLYICVTALLLTSFFWLPFLAEKQFVRAGLGFSTADYAQKFADPKSLLWSPWTYGGLQTTAHSGDFTYRVGLIYFLILFTLLITPKFRRQPQIKYWLMIAMGGSFMLTPWSNFIWQIFPPLQSVQFPWRLLWVPSLAICLALSNLSNTDFKQLKYLSILIVAIALHHIIFYAYPAGYISNSDFAWLNYPGTGSSNGEYDPIWFDNHQNMRLNERLVGRVSGVNLFTKDDQTGRGDITADINSWFGSAMNYTISTPEDIDVLQQTAYFPGWKVWVDGVDTPIKYQDLEFSGRIIFPVSLGTHEIKTAFTENTLDRKAGDYFTLLGLGIIGIQTMKLISTRKIFARFHINYNPVTRFHK
ncbi:hypothetical protein A3B57_00985 [Microgenomates group bacterium RIFCSPLOWO2_01_FULL_47_10]|nr:MAG: hypothetical protein A3B57_00985 [Microgenomates group bacterium RIFCSPLOWO2_01_FULL_47_10]